MRGKIRVVVRCRGYVGDEVRGNGSCVKVKDGVSLQIMSNNEKKPPLEFTFDKVLGPTARQTDVWALSKPLITSVVDGFNVTIFAYGQTGSGKTHTMSGDGSGMDGEGVIPRSIRELFDVLESKDEFYQYSVSCYFVELYVDKLIDLFSPPASRSSDAPKLTIHMDAHKMVYVKVRRSDKMFRKAATSKIGSSNSSLRLSQNAVVHPAPDADTLISLWSEGDAGRNVASTLLNSRSSRSHTTLSVIVTTRNRATGATTRAKMSLIDLAGSERVKKSGVAGQGMKEATSINKSLSALSSVICSLSNSSRHVPYRDSALTRLMRDSLGGNSKTLMLVAVPPGKGSVDETMMSLHYAARARMIRNKSVKGAGGGGGDDGEEMERLRMEVEALRRGTVPA